ncbi:MAG: RNA polymerase sporulation sigma factor SigK [Firmicutes bacterium]|nr:RNA polymerase sporulation sigma factor SigK [Bacillota bacterium]
MISGILTVAVYLARQVALVLGYLRNNTFPQPLSAEEEAEAVRRLHEGDRSARDLLIEHNLRLVAHIVKKYGNTRTDTDDLIQIGTIGLIKAVDTYEPNKGTKLATYAARCIENEILMHLRAIKHSRQDVSLNDPIGMDAEGNEITLEDILSADDENVPEIVEVLINSAEIQERLKTLEPREQEILIERFGLGGQEEKTQREIAKRMGISRSYVSRIEKRALTKLWRALLEAPRG